MGVNIKMNPIKVNLGTLLEPFGGDLFLWKSEKKINVIGYLSTHGCFIIIFKRKLIQAGRQAGYSRNNGICSPG